MMSPFYRYANKESTEIVVWKHGYLFYDNQVDFVVERGQILPRKFGRLCVKTVKDSISGNIYILDKPCGYY